MKRRSKSRVFKTRELEKMRRLLNIAEREGWILRNPHFVTVWVDQAKLNDNSNAATRAQ